MFWLSIRAGIQGLNKAEAFTLHPSSYADVRSSRLSLGTESPNRKHRYQVVTSPLKVCLLGSKEDCIKSSQPKLEFPGPSKPFCNMLFHLFNLQASFIYSKSRKDRTLLLSVCRQDRKSSCSSKQLLLPYSNYLQSKFTL
jgi:hypothetical protein